MSTFHAVVWMDHQQAHVLMFDREHVESQKIKSRSHHHASSKHAVIDTSYFVAIASALQGVHEILLCGPASAKDEFSTWTRSHATKLASAVVAVVAADHPTDAQLVALARKYFVKFDKMAADPSTN